jgi:membrane-bound lytic murein transglycosylase D
VDDGVVVVSPREFKYPDRERVFYRVRGGDTLGRIATACGTTRSDLLAWNALDPNARLQAGMTLQVWVKPSDDLSGVRVLRESEAQLLVAGTPEFFDHFEGLNGRKRIVVEARAGDTLASLGKRYGMSIGWMERINRRSRKKALGEGEKLVVYVAQNAPVRSVVTQSDPAPLPEVEDASAPPAPESPTAPAPLKSEKSGG